MSEFQNDAQRIQLERLSEMQLEEQARKRNNDYKVYKEDASSGKKRISRGAYVTIQLIVLLVIILAAIFAYHFLH